MHHFQSATLRPYLSAVRHTLSAAMCLQNFNSQVVERHNKPEVEVRWVIICCDVKKRHVIVHIMMWIILECEIEFFLFKLIICFIDRSSKELLMTAVVVSRNEKEKVLIEPSINSIRISISIKQADDIERILCHKFMRYCTGTTEAHWHIFCEIVLTLVSWSLFN